MIIRGGRILAAACYLPLSENSAISRELGTRHRAALGISESTDALVFIVSEETGIISLARDGRLSRYLDLKAMRALLMDMLIHNATDSQRSAMSPGRRREERNGDRG
jgi:diadenylate cyclase